ncbi:MAG: hypothetical protein KC636_17990, partial [Myxococcales bacterium]|nr:hypothetical protein [Myxococcales bacterium]
MSTLFLRIYASFVVTVVVFAGLVGLLVWVASSSWNEQRVLELADRADARGQELADALIAEDEVRAHEIAAALGEELDANVTIFPRVKGRRLGKPIGDPPHHGGEGPPPLTKAEAHHLRMGQPLVRRHGLGPPSIGLALFERGFFIN